MKRIVVTGGAGFIGSELVRQLAGHGFGVRVIDNLTNGRLESLEDVLGKNVEFLAADVRDRDAMSTMLRDAHIVFHLASLGVQHSVQSPAENHAVNASATLGLLQIARTHGVGRFVYVSSSEVYGIPRAATICEGHPTMPLTVYGASKLAGECYTRAFWETYRYPTTVLRAFHAYGPGSHRGSDCGSVIPEFMLRCLLGQLVPVFTKARTQGDFTFVSDMAAGIRAAGFAETTIGQTINLGSGHQIPALELAEIIAQVLGKTTPVIAPIESLVDRPMPLVPDIAKAKRLLSFEPTVDLRDGIARLRDWYAKQGGSAEELLRGELAGTWERRDLPTHAA